jgi:hypothetical protein
MDRIKYIQNNPGEILVKSGMTGQKPRRDEIFAAP